MSVARAATGAERRHDEDRIYYFFPRLAELRQRVGGLLSGGERQMMAIAAALMCRPTLLLIDELSLGLAPVVVGDRTRRLMTVRDEMGIASGRAKRRGALEIADYAYVMENGRVVLDGDRKPSCRNSTSVRPAGSRSYRDVKRYRGLGGGRRSRSSI